VTVTFHFTYRIIHPLTTINLYILEFQHRKISVQELSISNI